MGENVLGVLVAVALLASAAVLVLTHRARRDVLAFVVGVSAGLFGVQVLQVHVFTIVVVVWAVLSRRDGKSLVAREAVVLVGAAALLASTALFGELVNNPPLGLQLLALAVSGAIIIVSASATDIRTMLYGLLTVTSFSALFGLLQVAGIIPSDVWHLSISALGRPTGIYPEPDWLGMYSGVGLVLAWRLDLRRWLRVVLIAVTFSGLVLAFARAGWVATAGSVALAAAVALVVRSRSARRGATPDAAPATRNRSGRIAGVVVTVVLGVIALNSIPALHDNLITRLSRTLTVASDDVSAQARVQQNDGLLYLADSAPWYGWGISSSGRVGVSGRLNFGASDNNVGSNWILSMWVDGAWLSLPLIAVLLFACAAAVRTIQGQLLVLVLLNSFFSNATYQPITWFLAALCLVSLRHRREATVDVTISSKEKRPRRPLSPVT
ncbi:hypothetical protein [Agreia pratensis]|uniref:O-Antigen ligase n=1 Tax=Agreia pratensis TaxID=150121 RepID=A0A1X7IMH2_9MICO|nr:hypothetical protein [Agreia pratensis]SMG16191.1 hypothetical protein SAMN06296010_0672 [Agreia pratensis]